MAPELRIVSVQVVTAMVALIAVVVLDGHWLSALLGGGCSALPTFYAALRSRGARDPDSLWRDMVATEAQKLALMAALFVIVFVLFKTVEGLTFFGTFIACQLMPPILASYWQDGTTIQSGFGKE